jgi:hypothetical protein
MNMKTAASAAKWHIHGQTMPFVSSMALPMM